MARLTVYTGIDTFFLAERLRRAGYRSDWAFVLRLGACALAERQGLIVDWPKVEPVAYLRLM